MKNWTIGKRIIAGFAALILIAVALGMLAIINMRRSETEAVDVSSQEIPQVTSGNLLERTMLETMYVMRAYSYTEGTNFLADGMGLIAQLKQHLADAKTNSVADVRSDAEKVEPGVLKYEQLAQQTVAATDRVQQDRKKLDDAAKTFVAACNQYQDNMVASMASEISTNASPDALKTRLLKVDGIAEVLDAGNYCRIAIWRSQAQRDPQILLNGETNFITIRTLVDKLKSVTTQGVDMKSLDDCQASADSYKAAMDDLLKNWEAREDLNTERVAAANDALAAARQAAQSGLSDSAAHSNDVTRLMISSTRILVIGLIVAVALGIGLALFTTRGIAKLLTKVALALEDGSGQVASAAGQVSSSSQTLAEGASEQAASLEETSSSLEEMSSMTKRNAENSQKANDLAKQARETADHGVSDMQAMNNAMAAIKSSSDDIAKIIKTIDEIAFQTNILALNAAVEAARAGEAGMGFAVVADEVRNLAQRSAQAAKETAGKIEGAISKTAQGVEISQKVADRLNDIAKKSRQVDELVAEVSGASREQTQGITQINTAVGQMDKVTQSNAASAEESAAAAEELNAQAEAMKHSVAELMKLVGGDTSEAAAKPTAHAGHSKEVHAAAPTAKEIAAAKRAAAVQGNGHHRGTTIPMTGSVAEHRQTIPLEGDFKDF